MLSLMSSPHPITATPAGADHHADLPQAKLVDRCNALESLHGGAVKFSHFASYRAFGHESKTRSVERKYERKYELPVPIEDEASWRLPSICLKPIFQYDTRWHPPSRVRLGEASGSFGGVPGRRGGRAEAATRFRRRVPARHWPYRATKPFAVWPLSAAAYKESAPSVSNQVVFGLLLLRKDSP